MDDRLKEKEATVCEENLLTEARRGSEVVQGDAALCGTWESPQREWPARMQIPGTSGNATEGQGQRKSKLLIIIALITTVPPIISKCRLSQTKSHRTRPCDNEDATVTFEETVKEATHKGVPAGVPAELASFHWGLQGTLSRVVFSPRERGSHCAPEESPLSSSEDDAQLPGTTRESTQCIGWAQTGQDRHSITATGAQGARSSVVKRNRLPAAKTENLGHICVAVWQGPERKQLGRVTFCSSNWTMGDQEFESQGFPLKALVVGFA
ncbi:hypothetical protein H920_01038 [Fukomys damarensis]|uniref:Uncharacterized protein n=1 Tax=Fukomys damarensis TaxID=885580 RepID=A0A091E4A6_FUKDA|nr:hypothetical protein H920_01038 [Fukomys damarensis]